MRILLDASAYSAYARGQEEIAALVDRAEAVLLSVVVLGELLLGFRRGARLDQNPARLQSFLARSDVTLADVGRETAERYGEIAADLRAKGRPIPTNDIWIAAHAMAAGADLVSADAHFEHVDGLAWNRIAAR